MNEYILNKLNYLYKQTPLLNDAIAWGLSAALEI